MKGTGIEWTDDTWNPMRGCSRVSPGCQKCYAEKTAGRFCGPGKPYEGLVKITKGGERRWTGKVQMADNHLHDPLSWREPRKIFVNSMSDLFHKRLSLHDIMAVFGVMTVATRHTFQFLTKRELEMKSFYNHLSAKHDPIEQLIFEAMDRLRTNGQTGHAADVEAFYHREVRPYWPLQNVWAGVSVENQEHGKPRIDVLRTIPAKVRFLSIEPLLEDLGELDLEGIHWVIIGCESGPGARPCDGRWIRSIVDQCREQNVPVFLKQANEQIVTTQTSDGDYPHRIIGAGDRSHRKGGKLIGLPTLDGITYANFPKTEETACSS